MFIAVFKAKNPLRTGLCCSPEDGSDVHITEASVLAEIKNITSGLVGEGEELKVAW